MGPVDEETGRPVEREKGRYFRQFIRTLKGIGYRVEHRVLNSADFGDATARRRLFIIARKRGKIVWPEATHSPDGEADLFGIRPRWRGAKEVIDWKRKGRSIWGRKKDLVYATMTRLIAGAIKNGWPKPFVEAMRRLRDGDQDDGDIAAIMAAEASLTPFLLGQQSCAVARPISQPMPTVATQGAISLSEPILVPLDIEPMLAPYYGSGSGLTCTPVSTPMPTITTKARLGVVEAILREAASNEEIAELMKQGRIVVDDDRAYGIDVLFRMLEPEELSRAMSLSTSSRDYTLIGSKADQIKQVGNAVPVETAKALILTLLVQYTRTRARRHAGNDGMRCAA